MTNRFPLRKPAIVAPDAVAGTFGLPALSDLPANAAQVICVDDRPARPDVTRTERKVRGAGGQFVPVLLLATGPVVGPFSTLGAACGMCATLRMRARANASDFLKETDVWHHDTPGPLHLGHNPTLLAEAVMVAKRLFAQTTQNTLWHASMKDLQWQKDSILPVWSCPVCQPARSRNTDALAAATPKIWENHHA